MLNEEELEQLKVNTEAVKIRLTSEPYVVYNQFGYAVAVDVWLLKKRRKARLFLGSRTLGRQLEGIRSDAQVENFTGLEFWISKASDERNSAYVLTE